MKEREQRGEKEERRETKEKNEGEEQQDWTHFEANKRHDKTR
jgi:hypothetical protein